MSFGVKVAHPDYSALGTLALALRFKVNEQRFQFQLAHASRGFVRLDPSKSTLSLLLELVLLNRNLYLEKVNDCWNDITVVEEFQVSVASDRGFTDGTPNPGFLPSLYRGGLVGLFLLHWPALGHNPSARIPRRDDQNLDLRCHADVTETDGAILLPERAREKLFRFVGELRQ